MFSSLEHRRLRLFFLLYLGFVIYGSLIPFKPRPLTLEQALLRFHHITYLQLGAGSRADWIANIVLYIPLAFLGCAASLGLRHNRSMAIPQLVAVLALCLGLAVGLEFVQLFFAPRTVSLNDLIAEALGSLAGIGLWLWGRGFIARLLDSFTHGGRASVRAAAVAYALIYLLLALFPYDFVITGSELQHRLHSPYLGWLLAPSCGEGFRCLARSLGEILAVAPLGLLIALWMPHFGIRRLFLLSLVLGTVLEGLQILLISGTAQGLSVLLRCIGVVMGALAGRYLRSRGADWMARWLWRTILWSALPYLFALAALNGWLTSTWLPLSQGLTRLPELHLIPFYYHYFTSEPVAMASLLANAAMYAPLGLLLWSWRRNRRLPERGGAAAAALAAALLSLTLELGKLWLPAHHPDLTNPLIGAAAATCSYALTVWLGKISNRNHSPVSIPEFPAPFPPDETPSRQEDRETFFPVHRRAGGSSASSRKGGFTLERLCSLPAMGGIVIGLWQSPAPWLWLVPLTVYAFILWRSPFFWLFALPVSAPTLDLASFFGRLPLDGFDLIVLTTLAIAPWRLATPPRPWPPFTRTAFVLVWLSWLLSTYHGLQGLTFESLHSSHTPLAAWQNGKGLLWVLLLIPLLGRIPDPAQARRLVFSGVLTALVIEVGVVIWERHLFVGLGNFSSIFRVTGTFASMQTGGAYLEAFLAFAFPFLVVWTLTRSNRYLALAGLLLGAATVYAMLVTFSRGGYAGMAVGLATAVTGMIWQRRRNLHFRLTLAILFVVIAAVTFPIVSGGFAHYRLQRSYEDLLTRLQHWRHALGLLDDSWTARLSGMGFGRYPILYLLYGDYRQPPGGYAIFREGDNHYLRLLPGESVYLDQRVDLSPQTHYRLSARIRIFHQGEGLTVPLCEKALLYSFRCRWFGLRPKDVGHWRQMELTVDSGDLGTGGPWPHRPVKLSLHNAGTHPVEVDEIRLQDADGRELISNGGFERGTAHWLFVTDRDLAWHIHQAGIEVYFAQGWLGLAGLGLLLYASIKALLPGWRRGDPWDVAFLSGLAGFVTVSLTGSTLDAARSMMLFYFAAFCAVFFKKVDPSTSRIHLV